MFKEGDYMKKEIYEMAEMEIVAFDMPDVITTSGPQCDAVNTRVLYSENGCSDLYFTYASRECKPGYQASTDDGGCTTRFFHNSDDYCVDNIEVNPIY